MSIIIVSGTPGVGKSSIAEKLADAIGNAKHVDVSTLVKKEKLYSHKDKDRGTLVADRRRLTSAIQRLVGSGKTKTLVVSTHYLGSYLPREKVKRCFVLRLNPLVLQERLVSRRWSSSKVKENVEAELVGVCLYEAVGYLGRGKVRELDTTGKTVGDVVDQMVESIAGPGKNIGRPGSVDWLGSYDFRTLGHVEEEGD